MNKFANLTYAKRFFAKLDFTAMMFTLPAS